MPAFSSADERVVYLGWIRVTIAGIVLLLLLLLCGETFLFRSFVIFTSSMEPTVAGRSRGGDRVIVSKVHYQIEDPRRWDISLFTYENNRSTSYLKRLVGLGGEQILILGGDVYRASPDFCGTALEGVQTGEITILRKPARLLEGLVRSFPVPFARGAPPFTTEAFWTNFQRPEAGAELWTIENGVAHLDGSSVIESRVRPGDTLYDCRSRDPAGVAGTVLAPGRNPVGDLSFRLDVMPEGESGPVVIAIKDPAQERRIVARIGVGSARQTIISLGSEVLEQSSISLAPGEWTDIRLDNLDDRITLWIDGHKVMAQAYTHDPVADGAEQIRGPGGVQFGAEGASVRFRNPEIYRDIYYDAQGQTRFLVPEGHYLFLGDNSLTSADSRLWKRTAIHVHASGTILEGDSLGVTAKSVVPPGRNPWMEPDGSWVFVDDRGKRHTFETESAFTKLGTWPTPYVPRRALLGRGLAILAPLGRIGLLR
jgi:signal peptidase I